MRVMLHKIVNNALYMGVVAHEYQIHLKSVDHNSDIIMSLIHSSYIVVAISAVCDARVGSDLHCRSTWDDWDQYTCTIHV